MNSDQENNYAEPKPPPFRAPTRPKIKIFKKRLGSPIRIDTSANNLDITASSLYESSVYARSPKRLSPKTPSPRGEVDIHELSSPSISKIQNVADYDSSMLTPDSPIPRSEKKREEVRFATRFGGLEEEEKQSAYDSVDPPPTIDYQSSQPMTSHSPFASLEREIQHDHPSSAVLEPSSSNFASKFLKSSSTVITLPRQIPDPTLSNLEKRLFALVVQLSILIKSNHFSLDVIQEYYPLRELIKQESRIPKSELSMLKVNVLRLLKKNPQVEKQFKIWKQFLLFLNDICGKWRLLKIDNFNHRVDPRLQTLVRVISYRNLNRHYVGLETIWLTCLTSPLKFIINKELSTKAVALRQAFLQTALMFVQDYPNTVELRKAVYDFEHIRFRKSDSVIRNEQKEKIFLKNQPVLFPRRPGAFLNLDIQQAEQKYERAQKSRWNAIFRAPSKSQKSLIKWKAELESFLEKYVDFQRSFMQELFSFVAPQEKSYFRDLSESKSMSTTFTQPATAQKYSIASQLGIKGKEERGSKLGSNQSTAADSTHYQFSIPQTTPKNNTPRSEIGGFFQQNSAGSVELKQISHFVFPGVRGGELSPAEEEEEAGDESSRSVNKKLEFEE